MNKLDYLSSSLPVDQSWFIVESDASPPDIAPDCYVSISQLECVIEQVPSSSSNSVKKMKLLENDKSAQVVYYKGCSKSYPPILAQIEAAASASCLLTRPNKVAKIRNVIDDIGNIIGSISFEIFAFKPFKACTLTLEDLIFYNAAEAIVCRYVRQDDDYHPENGGLSVGAIVDIDFDSFWYPVTADIKGLRLVNNGYFGPLPANAFPLTLRDLNDIPNIKDQVPCHWPSKSPSNMNSYKEWKQKELIQKLAGNVDFQKQKWMALLQEAMILPEMHAEVISPHFAKLPESQMMKQRLYCHIVKRHDDLAALLPHSLEFRKFIRLNSKSYAKITELFQRTDENFLEHESKIKQRFFMIVRSCLVKDLVMALFDIGSHLHKIQPIQNDLIQAYDRLIDIVQQFHEKDDSFEVAFNQLEFDLIEMRSFLSPHPNMGWFNSVKQFLSCFNKYRGFCHAQVQSMAASIYPAQTVKDANKPLDTTDAPEIIAREICRWLLLPGHLQRILSIIKVCKEDYEPGAWNPKNIVRRRSEDFDTLSLKIEESRGDPVKIMEAILEFFKDGKGAWNQAWFGGYASANVLLMDKLARAAIEDFVNMMSPKILKNYKLVEVCFLIKNEKWKLIEHVQAIAQKFNGIDIKNLL